MCFLDLKIPVLGKDLTNRSNVNLTKNISLREKCPYSEFLWSVFTLIWTEYGEILRNIPNTDTFHAVFK